MKSLSDPEQSELPPMSHTQPSKRLFSLLGLAIPLLLVLFLAYKNYTPGTFLSGWDNLHPEFDFALNVRRSLSAAWQEYQGLGLLGGMAHAADLPRQLILWLFSLIMPLNFLRSFWVFAMLLLGPLGTYFFVRLLTTKERTLPATIASLFYLLNLAMLQTFYTSFETFVSFYGFLPWLLYLGLRYIKDGGRKKLLAFLLVSFLATSAFYVQTLFIVYVVFLGVFGLEVALRGRFLGIKRFLSVALVVFTVNSYWLLPASYFTLTNSRIFSLSHQNSIASPDTRYFNQNRGTFDDIVKLKGFWFDYRDLNDNTFEEVVGDWSGYTASKNFHLAAYILFFSSILGLVFGLFSKKVGARIAGAILFGVCYLMLSSHNLPLGPTLSEAFRSVFTKWSVAFALILALGLGYFVYFVQTFGKAGKYLAVILAVGLVSLMIFTVKPAFEGKLFYQNLKVTMPKEYFEVFEYFKNKPKEERIGTLPLNTFWGWDFYSWGGRGSGFLWYGIPQPILHRSFDVWSPHNETFYAEAARALYASENETFEKVLAKYQIKYLLLDESIINAGGSPGVLFVPEIKEIIASSQNIHEVARFGTLLIYETNFATGNKFVSAPETFWRFDTDSTYSQSDTVFTSYGNYINDSEGTTFPFVNFDKRMGVKVRQEAGELIITSNELHFSGTKNIVAPDGPGSVFVNDSRKVQVNLLVDQKTSADLVSPEQESYFQNCDLKKIGEVQRQNLEDPERSRGIIHKAASGGVACEFFNFPDISHSEGYLMHIKGENRQGRGLKIYLQNWLTNKMDLEELLPEGAFDEYFFVLPSTIDNQPSTINSGYSLNLETRSFGRIASENVIETIEFIPVPIAWLQEIRLEPTLQGLAFKGSTLQGVYSVQNILKILNVKKKGTWFYRVETEGEGLLELGQGYEKGWVAFARPVIRNTKYQIQRLQHFKVNSWANGFLVSTNLNESQPISTIYIVFWPQLLEYLGLGLLGLTTVILGFKMIKVEKFKY